MQKEKYKGEAQVTRATRLREARRRRFDSIEAAAHAHGWSAATLNAHERSARAFKYERAEEYAKAFGVDIGWLWNGREAEAHPPGSSLRRDTDAAHSCEKMIAQAKELVEHIQRAIEAGVRLYALTATQGPLDVTNTDHGGSAERR